MLPAGMGDRLRTQEIVWEDVACPLCDRRDEELILTTDGGYAGTLFHLVRCRFCSLGYLNPRPDQHSIRQFYPNDYKPHQARQQSQASAGVGWMERLVLRGYFGHPPRLTSLRERLLASLLYPFLAPRRDSHTAIPFHGNGKLLDLGCGGGWFAHRMRQRGWDVVGIDVSSQAARTVSEVYGIPVLVGTLPHPAVVRESFDVVNMGSVLEHVSWPHSLIEAVVKALRPGGLLALSVPNLDGWSLRHFGSACFNLDLPRHLLHFNPRTLRRLLESHGFELCELRMFPRVSWVRRTLRVAELAHRAGWKRLLLRLGRVGPATGLLTRWTCWTQQSDCLFALAQKKVRRPVWTAA